MRLRQRSGDRVIEALQVLLGALVAILLDWAIYTHLSAYVRVSFPATPYLRYREIAFGSSTASIRTSAVCIAGLAAGFAFASKQGDLWIFSLGLFALVHSVIYALLHKQTERP